MNDQSSGNFAEFMWIADGFFTTYSLMCEYAPFLIFGNIFSLGHSVELYLKAVYIYQTGNLQQAFNYAHNIKRLYAKCQNEDYAFMPNFTIQKYNIENNINADHYYENQEFYIIAENLANLKYGGFPKDLKNSRLSFITLRSHNPYWIEFVKNIRSYLNYPGEKYIDFIKLFLETNENMSGNARIFLSQIYK